MESVPKCPLQGTHSSLTGEGLLPHSLLEWSEWLLGARKVSIPVPRIHGFQIRSSSFQITVLQSLSPLL